MALKLSITLEPIVSKDPETGLFVAKFADLPNAIAFDESSEKAVLRLISILEVVLQEQRELVYEKLIKKHLEEALKGHPSYQLVRIQGVNTGMEEMKLQLVS
jgi:predicted RNase H-like HicB family nuclease